MKRILYSIGLAFLLLLGYPMNIYAESQSTTLSYEVNPTITYIDGNHSTTQKVEYGSLLKEPNHLNKEGYRFLGWMNKETGLYWDFTQAVESNLTLVACYEKLGGQEQSASTSKSPQTGIEFHNDYFLFGFALMSCVFLSMYTKRKRS